MKVYHGRRSEYGCAVDVEENGEVCLLDPRLDLRHHSATGFGWGNAGREAAQLALALAADVLGDDKKAKLVYERLKFKLVAGLPDDDWVLSENRIRTAIEAIEQSQGLPR